MPTQSHPGLPSAIFRERVRDRTPVVGTFVKSTSHQTIEVLGHSGMDFVVLDAEHAPFGMTTLDSATAAARAAQLPALVRIPSHSPAFINSCLDMGANGVLVPHTLSGDNAEDIADAVKYARGKRGFSPSGRGGNYGQVDFTAYRNAADAGSSIWCQIEDRAAMDHLDAIAAVDDIDCLFIGPADLGISLGCDGPDDPRLAEAIRAIAQAGQRHGRTVGLFVPNTNEIPEMIALGISVFICSSDQGLMLGRARQVVTAVAEASR